MILVWDTETTGLPLHPAAGLAKQPRVIEFGAVELNARGAIINKHSQLFNPGVKLTPEIQQITGLTDEALAGAPTFKEHWPKLRKVFDRCRAMACHNMPFDMTMIKYELMRLGVDDFHFPEQRICTAQQYEEEWGRRPRLLELYEKVMGKPLAQTHRALDDAMALCEVFRKEKLWTALSLN